MSSPTIQTTFGRESSAAPALAAPRASKPTTSGPAIAVRSPIERTPSLRACRRVRRARPGSGPGLLEGLGQQVVDRPDEAVFRLGGEPGRAAVVGHRGVDL